MDTTTTKIKTAKRAKDVNMDNYKMNGFNDGKLDRSMGLPMKWDCSGNRIQKTTPNGAFELAIKHFSMKYVEGYREGYFSE